MLIWQQVEIPAAFQRQVTVRESWPGEILPTSCRKQPSGAQGLPVLTSHSSKELTLVARLAGSRNWARIENRVRLEVSH